MNLEKLSLPLEVADTAFKAGIAGAIAGVGALVGAMGLAIKTTFDWAEGLDQIGDIMDVNNQQAAAFNYIAHKSGVATETFTKGVVILSKGLVKADGSLDTTGKGLAEWGINVKDVSGNLKSQTTLMDEISQKYGTFATQQEKVNFLTQIFGRSGAELVDFFDVLAKEGGMDAVTKKVEALGLAIDPGRYENFTRNLEEIKLIGTGLAVSFTEKLMPSLEGILDWVTRFAGADPAQKFAMLADPLKMLFNLTDAFKRGVDGIDWAGLSKKIADGINKIDWKLVGNYIRQGVSNVLQGIWTIVSNIDWGALASSIGNALKDLFSGLFSNLFTGMKNIDPKALGDSIRQWFDGIDWAGMSQKLIDEISNIDWVAVGDNIGATTLQLLDIIGAVVVESVLGIGRAIAEIDWAGLQDAIGTALQDLVAGIIGYPDWESLRTAFFDGINSLFGFDIIGAFTQMQTNFQAGTFAISELFTAWGQIILAWWNQLWVDFNTASMTLSMIFTSMYTAAFNWWNQMLAWGQSIINWWNGLWASFNSGVDSLNNTFSNMYNVAAGWVEKIMGLADGIGNLFGNGTVGGASGTSNLGNGRSTRRASGGAVIAGQQYSVGEFYRPEKFTPAVNGRIDSMGGGSQAILEAIQNSRMDEAKLARVIVTALKQGWAI